MAVEVIELVLRGFESPWVEEGSSVQKASREEGKSGPKTEEWESERDEKCDQRE